MSDVKDAQTARSVRFRGIFFVRLHENFIE